jgi:uncharacterized protein YqjF (DUF2071 family)
MDDQSDLARKEFLSAKWTNLILVSYEVDPALLKPFLPGNTEIDFFEGKAYVSLVAFQFRQTRIYHVPIPFHINFPEVNLRFYAKANGKRGAIFLRELVPLRLVSSVARSVYNEPYYYCPMSEEATETPTTIAGKYSLEKNGQSSFVRVLARNEPFTPTPGSLEHFLKEHCRGYGQTKNGETLVYNVAHQVWRVFPILEFEQNIRYGDLYGTEWKFLEHSKPANVAFAEGSKVQVFNPKKLSAIR